MKIGLIDVDGHNGHPNLALMRLSAYHKAQGDDEDTINHYKCRVCGKEIETQHLLKEDG